VISLFGGKKPNHPMADIKEARKLLEELPTSDAFKCADELTHWLESVMAEEGFKPEYRAQLIQLLDETAQIHLRKLARDYMASPRLAKFQEIRLWKAIYEYWRQAALAYAVALAEEELAGHAQRDDQRLPALQVKDDELAAAPDAGDAPATEAPGEQRRRLGLGEAVPVRAEALDLPTYHEPAQLAGDRLDLR